MLKTLITLTILIILTCLSGLTKSFAQESVHTVKGTVHIEDGAPVSGAIVTISPGAYADTTDVSGNFSIDSVPAGDYMLTAKAPSNPGTDDYRKKISIDKNGTENISVILKRRSYLVDEVVVISKKKKTTQPEDDTPSNITVIERSEFENSAATVADVIESTPSASITSMGGLGDFTEVSLRGSYSNQVQIYLDGMLLNEAVGGAVNSGTIPLTHVEKIEVWRSGTPAKFGGDAVGGAINIVTRNSLSTEQVVSLGYGSFDTRSAGTVLNIPFGSSRFHTTIDYSSSANDFEYKSDNGTMYFKGDDYSTKRRNDQYRSANVLSKFSHLFGNGMFFELSEHILSNKKHLPRKDNALVSEAAIATARNLFQAKLSVNPFLSDILETSPTFQHSFSREHYKDPGGKIGWGVQDNVYETQSFTFLSPLTASLGKFGAIHVTPTSKREFFRPENRLQPTIPLSCDREQLAIVGDILLKTPDDRLTVSGNFRRDRYFSSFGGYTSALNRNTPDSRFDFMSNSHAGARLQILKNAFLRWNYADITRAPTFYELFGDRGSTLSNPDLKPESIYRWDVGGKIIFDGAGIPVGGAVECVWFNNNYRDLIQWYTYDAGFIKPDNVGGAYVRGTEIIWNGNLLDRLSITGNWTFQQSKVTSEVRKYYRGKQLPNRPENYGTVKVEAPVYRVKVFWSLDRKSSYYLDRANQDHLRYSGRSLHNAGVTVPFREGRMRCSLLMKNIADVRTFDTVGMPKPGRSIMFTVTHSFSNQP